jgi:hypothetical protein
MVEWEKHSARSTPLPNSLLRRRTHTESHFYVLTRYALCFQNFRAVSFARAPAVRSRNLLSMAGVSSNRPVLIEQALLMSHRPIQMTGIFRNDLVACLFSLISSLRRLRIIAIDMLGFKLAAFRDSDPLKGKTRPIYLDMQVSSARCLPPLL